MEKETSMLPIPGNDLWRASALTLKVGEFLSEPSADRYECIVRKLSEVLHGKHYAEESAMRDVYKIHYTDANGSEHKGPHWTVEQVEAATAGKKFPEGTTKWDKYIAYNTTYADLNKVLTEEQILKTAYALWFSDEDWYSDGKIWDYMSVNRAE